MKIKETVIPVFLGADQNCYGMARAFHAAAHCRCYAFGKMRLGATAHCPYLVFNAVPELGEKETMIRVLREFAEKTPGKRFLFPCTDEYVQMLAESGALLSDLYTVFAPTPEEVALLRCKDTFYRMCDLFRIPYPKTRILTLPVPHFHSDAEYPPFSYPAILKPADGVDYFRHPFPEMEKVYTVKSKEEVYAVTDDWYKAGYRGHAVLQDLVPGPDDCIHVITFYSDKNAKVKAVAAARVLLEEQTKKGKGNHAACLSEKPPAIARTLAAMLERIGYRGICHFDLKFDSRDGSMRVFEINLRQGRSNLYLLAAGCNLAELIIKDHIDNETLQYKEYYRPTFWYSIPKKTVYRYTADRAAVMEARRLSREGRAISASPGLSEIWKRPLLLFYNTAHAMREEKKYRRFAVRRR